MLALDQYGQMKVVRRGIGTVLKCDDNNNNNSSAYVSKHVVFGALLFYLR